MWSTGSLFGLQVELEVFDVREADLFRASGAAAAVLEVHLLERFCCDLPQPLLGGALFLSLEETGGVAGRQGEVRCRMRSWSVEPIGAV